MTLQQQRKLRRIALMTLGVSLLLALVAYIYSRIVGEDMTGSELSPTSRRLLNDAVSTVQTGGSISSALGYCQQVINDPAAKAVCEADWMHGYDIEKTRLESIPEEECSYGTGVEFFEQSTCKGKGNSTEALFCNFAESNGASTAYGEICGNPRRGASHGIAPGEAAGLCIMCTGVGVGLWEGGRRYLKSRRPAITFGDAPLMPVATARRE